MRARGRRRRRRLRLFLSSGSPRSRSGSCRYPGIQREAASHSRRRRESQPDLARGQHLPARDVGAFRVDRRERASAEQPKVARRGRLEGLERVALVAAEEVAAAARRGELEARDAEADLLHADADRNDRRRDLQRLGRGGRAAELRLLNRGGRRSGTHAEADDGLGGRVEEAGERAVEGQGRGRGVEGAACCVWIFFFFRAE